MSEIVNRLRRSLRSWSFFPRNSAPVHARRIKLDRAVPIVEFSLAAAIGLFFVFFVFALFAPLPMPNQLPVAAPPANEQVASLRTQIALNPFRTAEIAAPAQEVQQILSEDLEETSLDLRLHGTWIDEGGGSAIIRDPDGKQATFRVGDEIWSGVTLDGIYAQQVTISRNGVRETLSLVNRDRQAVVRARAQAVSSQPQNLNIADFSSIVQVTPKVTPDGLVLTLVPGENGTAFEYVGLRPGDRLVSVNDKRITGDLVEVAEMFKGLKPGQSVEIVVLRDGLPVPLDIEIPTRNGELSFGQR